MNDLIFLHVLLSNVAFTRYIFRQRRLQYMSELRRTDWFERNQVLKEKDGKLIQIDIYISVQHCTHTALSHADRNSKDAWFLKTTPQWQTTFLITSYAKKFSQMVMCFILTPRKVEEKSKLWITWGMFHSFVCSKK